MTHQARSTVRRMARAVYAAAALALACGQHEPDAQPVVPKESSQPTSDAPATPQADTIHYLDGPRVFGSLEGCQDQARDNGSPLMLFWENRACVVENERLFGYLCFSRPDDTVALKWCDARIHEFRCAVPKGPPPDCPPA